MKVWGFVALFGLLLLITRFYNLENTTRFIWDESSDLVRAHQIYIENKLTLIGPISEDNSKVFGSLAYYLSMPFMIMAKFDPISPIFGTITGGIITIIGLLILYKKLNPSKPLIIISLIVLTWFPLLQSNRSGFWAWHVSYIPMWLTLGILMYLKNNKLSMVLAGLFLGLTIHHHYISIFSISFFITAAGIYKIRYKNYLQALGLFIGLIIAILPFIIFDLRHPPGLFLSKIIYNSPITQTYSLELILQKFTGLFTEMTVFFTQSWSFALILKIIIVFLVIWDLKKRQRNILWLAGWVGQLIGLIFIQNDGFSIHYLLPTSIFFFAWVITSRKGLGAFFSATIILLLTISSIFSLKYQLFRKNWQTDIPSVRLLTNAMKKIMDTKNLKNSNLAVLASPDNNVYGRRYRDVLLVNNIKLRTKDEYQYSDYLFVISVAKESVVRMDKAYEMNYFRNGDLLNKWSLPDSEWNLYLFNQNPR